jgi:predicted AAA+ superfamily ATPase
MESDLAGLQNPRRNRDFCIASKASLTYPYRMYHKRTLEPRLCALAGMYSCVLVTGIRQAGKTELVRHAFPGHEWILLDRAGIVSEARSDAALFLSNHQPPCIFDEVQRVPELFLELKDPYYFSGCLELPLFPLRDFD